MRAALQPGSGSENRVSPYLPLSCSVTRTKESKAHAELRDIDVFVHMSIQ